VSCGIPDFRSAGGVYDSIAARFDLPQPECLFDLEYFKHDPRPFYLFAKVHTHRERERERESLNNIIIAACKLSDMTITTSIHGRVWLEQEIYPGKYEPSLTHKFIRLLERKGKLLCCYTQNIDTLEQSAGIKRVVYCHGSFATASCVQCRYQVAGSAIEPEILAAV
jgi:NAD+-dependent protein deacetylase sirtuin 1